MFPKDLPHCRDHSEPSIRPQPVDLHTSPHPSRTRPHPFSYSTRVSTTTLVTNADVFTSYLTLPVAPLSTQTFVCVPVSYTLRRLVQTPRDRTEIGLESPLGACPKVVWIRNLSPKTEVTPLITLRLPTVRPETSVHPFPTTYLFLYRPPFLFTWVASLCLDCPNHSLTCTTHTPSSSWVVVPVGPLLLLGSTSFSAVSTLYSIPRPQVLCRFTSLDHRRPVHCLQVLCLDTNSV